MSYGVSKGPSVEYGMLHVVANSDRLVTRRHVMLGSIRTCLLQNVVLRRINQDISIARRHALVLFQ